MLASLPPRARRLYTAWQTSYDVTLPADAASAAEEVRAAAQAIYGERWNYQSDALRPEIVKGFADSLDAVAQSPVAYLEIGSCQGLSLALIALLMRRRGRLGRCVSVDPYFDSGYVEGEKGPYGQALRIKSDKETLACARSLYERFAIDVELREQTSLDALRDLIRESARFDLIYIDGSHEKLWPMIDFGLSFSLLNPGGVIILDDHMWPDVEPVKALCDAHGVKVQQTWKTASYGFPNV
jgi:predicted O-methyltransferase YrrM